MSHEVAIADHTVSLAVNGRSVRPARLQRTAGAAEGQYVRLVKPDVIPSPTALGRSSPWVRCAAGTTRCSGRHRAVPAMAGRPIATVLSATIRGFLDGMFTELAVLPEQSLLPVAETALERPSRDAAARCAEHADPGSCWDPALPYGSDHRCGPGIEPFVRPADWRPTVQDGPGIRTTHPEWLGMTILTERGRR
jgi:hypothetical protein